MHPPASCPFQAARSLLSPDGPGVFALPGIDLSGERLCAQAMLANSSQT